MILGFPINALAIATLCCCPPEHSFGKEFEERYIGQRPDENRSMEETLDLGWELLGKLPREELDRVDTKILDKYYKPAPEE